MKHKEVLRLSFIPLIIGIVTPALLWLAGLESFALLSLYACFPLILTPIIVIGIRDQGFETSALNARFLVIVCLFATSIALITGSASPRPRVFFVSLSVAATVSIVYCLQHGSRRLPLAMTAGVIAIFHASTTLTNGIWIASGDGAITWVGVENIVRSHQNIPSAGYDNHPLYFFGGAILAFLGFPTEIATFGFGLIIALAALGFTYLLSSWSRIFPKGQTALPALLLPFLYKFNFAATYSVASTAFALLSILPVAVVSASVFKSKRLDKRWSIFLLVFLISIAFYHRIAHAWLIMSIVLIASATLLVGRLPKKEFERQSLRSVSILVLIFIILFIYLFSTSGLPKVIYMHLVGLSTSPGTGGPSALAEPVGLFVSFLGSSVTLILFLAGCAVILTQSGKSLTVIGLIGTIFAALYYPGPAYLIDFEMFRVSRYATPFIALIVGVGLLKLWTGSTRSVQALLIVLLLTGGVLTLSSDIYSRDNPIAQSGTFTNYLSNQDQQASEFSFSTSNEIAYERSLNQYHRGRADARRWGEIKSSAAYPTSKSELCKVMILTDFGERRNRGEAVYGSISVTNSGTLKEFHRNVLYSNGNNKLLSKCG